MSSGKFISFEGTEGAGKSTQIQLLAERLKNLGVGVVCLREPGGTKIGEEIRNTLQHSHQNHGMAPETELLLVNASRAQLVREIIRPALICGQIVLCDRFYDSTIAYQGFGRKLDLDFVEKTIGFAVGETKPSLTIFIKIPLKMSQVRRQQRAYEGPEIRDRMEEQSELFFERVASGFERQALREPERVKCVDGTQEIPLVHEAVWKLVKAILPPKND